MVFFKPEMNDMNIVIQRRKIRFSLNTWLFSWKTGPGSFFFQYNFEETNHFIEQSKFTTPHNNKEINHQALLNISYDSMKFWASFSRRIGPDQTNVGSSENVAFKSNHNSYDIRHLRQRLTSSLLALERLE